MQPRASEFPRRPLISEEFLRLQRRDRIVRSVAECAHGEGLAGLTVSRLVERGHMARRTFYDHFASRQEAVDYACKRAGQRLTEAIGTVRESPNQAEAAIDALLGAVAADPLLAELCLVHSPGAAPDDPGRYVQPLVGRLSRPLGEGTHGELAALAILFAVRMLLIRGQAGGLSEFRDGLVVLAGGGARSTGGFAAPPVRD